MTTEHKHQIANELMLQSAQSSQNKMAAKLGISTATVSQIINGNWKLIKDEMWRKVKVNLKVDLDWNVVETSNMQLIKGALMLTQSKSMAIGIAENAGIGKTEAFKAYARKYKNVVMIECKHYWTRKSYIKNICLAAGLEDFGKTEELIARFTDYMKGLDRPLMIIDQADKLKDPQLDLFMDFYNDLFKHCGFVLSGVKALDKRIRKGVQKDKSGYKELWSRIGSKFYDQIEPTTIQDVALICKANGVTDSEIHQFIYNVCAGDIRKVRIEIEKQQMMNPQD